MRKIGTRASANMTVAQSTVRPVSSEAPRTVFTPEGAPSATSPRAASRPAECSTLLIASPTMAANATASPVKTTALNVWPVR